MKTKFKKSGVTLVELTMVLAVTAIATTAIVTFLVQSNKLSVNTSHASNTLSSKVVVFTEIMTDLRSAKRASLGSIMANGDFEMKLDDAHPLWWNNTVTGNGNFSYVTSISSLAVQHGIHSITLQSSDGSQVAYTAQNTLNFRIGQAYMISGWVRTTNANTTGGLELISSDNSYLCSSTTISTSWSRLVFRYPSSGLLSSQSSINLRATVNNGNATVYFDDIQCAVINSVVAALSDSDINVLSSPTDASNPFENTGFHFVRTSEGQQELCRYRIVSDNGMPALARDVYDATASSWQMDSKLIGQNIKSLSFSFDANSQLPAQGPDSPLIISFLVSDPSSKDSNLASTGLAVQLYALTP